MGAPCLSKRLNTVASLVREGAVLADVGTDHAYLPIALLLSGKIKSAVCADINEGPLALAKKNAEAAGVDTKIDFYLSDGFDKIPRADVTDVAICGMGGELILDIVSRATPILSNGVSLILQPMSREWVLRRGLYSLGFEIVREEFTLDSGKYYLVLLARYTGVKQDISESCAYLGTPETRAEISKEQIGYFKAKRRALQKSVDGLLKSGKSCPEKEEIILEIDKILNL